MSALRALPPLLALSILVLPSAAAVHAGLEARPSWDPAAPRPGDVLSVQVSFVNVGNESTPAGVARVLLNDVEVAANELPSLPPGRRTTVVARPASVGDGETATLEVRFRAEGGDEVVERRDVITLAAPAAVSPSPEPPAATPMRPMPSPAAVASPTAGERADAPFPTLAAALAAFGAAVALTARRR